MAGETISHGGYELDHLQQLELGKSMCNLLRGYVMGARATTQFSDYSLCPTDLGEGRFRYYVNLVDQDGLEERVRGEMEAKLAARGDLLRDALKRKFPELRRVELKVMDCNVLAVTCTLDEMVDSTPESYIEAADRLAGLGVAELTRRGGILNLAMKLKGRKLFHALGIDGVEFDDAGYPSGQVVCLVRCTAEAFPAFAAKMKSFDIVHYTLGSEGPSSECVCCMVSPEVFDSGVWPEVKGVAGVVAEDVAAVAGGSGSES